MGKFLDALKNIGLKVNGKKPTSTTTVAVLNEIANDYETPTSTEVVANPTLAGTEDTLTGLQVGETKYAVPQGGGKTYNHFVKFTTEDIKLVVLIPSTKATAFTTDELKIALSQLTPCSGGLYDESDNVLIYTCVTWYEPYNAYIAYTFPEGNDKQLISPIITETIREA